MFSLHRYFLKLRRQRELSELLSYAYLYNENTVIHKDGAFSAHFRYVAQDVDSSTGSQLDANAYAVFQALGLLEDGWMIETNLVSSEEKKYSKAQGFQDVVSALIDDARRYHFEQDDTFYRSTCFLSLSYVPTSMFGKKLSKLMVDSDERSKSLVDEHQSFENTVQRFITQFKKITRVPDNGDETIRGLERLDLSQMVRLAGSDLTTFLNRNITGKSNRINIPKTGFFLDAFLSTDNFIAGVIPKIGNKWIKVIAIDDLPELTYPAILDELNYLGFEYRWSTRFIPLSKSTAGKYLKSQKNRWSNKAIGLIGVIKMALGIAPQIDESAELRKLQTSDAMLENGAGLVRFGFMSSVIILMHEDREALSKASESLCALVESLSFKVRDEQFNATEGYLGSLPGHGCYNIRKPMVDSIYVSHTVPTSSVWQGSHTCPCPLYPKKSPALMYVRTKGSRSFRVNIHVSDVGHFTVLGPTGNGKSTLIALMGCQFRKYPRSRIIVFDKDNSNEIWLKTLGGDYFDVYGGASFAPLALLADVKEGTIAYEAELTFLTQWVSEICELQEVKITPDRKEKIIHSLRSLSKAGKEHLRLELLSIQDPEVRQAIDNFNSGAIAKMINGLEDKFGLNSVIGLEMGELLKLPEALYIPIIRCVFHRLTQLFKDRRPTLLILEEAWSFLRHSIFESMLEDWLLTLRKYNVAVGFISQNLDHVTASRISDTIKESCPTKFYLPNNSLNDRAVIKKYEHFGLNEQQIDILLNAIPKHDYYMTSPLGCRLFQLDLSPLELAFIGNSTDHAITQFKKHFRANDPSWIVDWLAYKGLDDWIDYTRKVYFSEGYHVENL